MKHLFFLLDFYTPHRGGIENVFENLIFRLLKKWYKITLLTSRFDPSLPQQEVEENLTIYRVGNGRKSFFFQSLRMGAKILRTNKNIGVIHSSTYTSAIPASILGMVFKKKKILTVHEIFGKLRKTFKPWYSRWIFQLFEWLTFQFPQDGYHCVSLYTLNSIRIHYGLPDQKLHLIYNGVDSDFWDAKQVSEAKKSERRNKIWGKEKFLILYYGHSGISKGIDYLIEAIPEILKQNPDSMLIFNLIPAKRDSEIKEKIKAKGPAQSVQIFSWYPKEELRELIATADLLIAPSLAEGFGSVHSESCAMGKALLTTQVASIPEVVSGEAKLISPGSSEEIVQGIQEIRHKKLTPLPKKTFNRDKSIEKMEKLYQL